MYGDYGYHFEDAVEELGRSCDKARRNLLLAAGDRHPIHLFIGAIDQGGYGPMPLENIGDAAGRFDKFCNALETFPNSRVIDSLKFHHFRIRSDRMISIVESAIKAKHIKELEFKMCFDYESKKGLDLVSRFLEGNQTLEKLTNDVGILNTGFSKALRDHPTLETLANFSCSDQQFGALIGAVKDISDVSIGRMEIAHLIPPVLATNPQMQKFRVRGAGLTKIWNRKQGEDEDAVVKSFAHALSTNTNLKQLTLDILRPRENQILLKAIYNDTSLNTLAMSNHTCRILEETGDSWSNPTFKRISEDYKWIQGGETSIARKSKLLCAIGTFDESCIDVMRFSEGPSELLPKLIPMMLEFVQGVHIFEQIDTAKLERLAFKNVYELMRNIVAPSLQPKYYLHDIQTGGSKRKRDVTGVGTEN
eukprot:scaffold4867_cov136-Skeletonema_dohrnii-CCMP3373.AAC.9